MSENKQCKDEWCGPAPFANTPPIGLAPELLQQQDVLPDWKSIAPELHEDAAQAVDRFAGSRVAASKSATPAKASLSRMKAFSVRRVSAERAS